MENEIFKHRQAVVDNIYKSFEDNIQKAHYHGEIHKNGKWYWNSQAAGGKGDWRVIKKRGEVKEKPNIEKPPITRKASHMREKRLSYDEFGKRVDSLRKKVKSFTKNWSVSPDYYIGYTNDLKTFNRRNEITIPMLDERDNDVKNFIVKENFTNIWILANFFFLSKQKIKSIINESQSKK